MDSLIELYLTRAEDEYLLAKKDLQLSTDNKTKEFLGVQKNKTFFFSVISHAYYSIFQCAKAYLLSKGIKTAPPNEHGKVYRILRMLVKRGVLDKELFIIYENELIKANPLLKIFKIERKKRSIFTYDVKSESNLPYAQESIKNSERFVSIIKKLLEK